MKVIFFEVDNVLNFPSSDAVAPSGAKGVAESCVKKLRDIIHESGAKLVLCGSWTKEWDFHDEKCSEDGKYLNRKLNRRGLHIMDKVKDDLPMWDAIQEWLERHDNVTECCKINNLEYQHWQDSKDFDLPI